MKCQHRTCPHCHLPFIPNKHNAYHQRYCGQPPCRQASAQDKRSRWRQKHKDDLDFRAREVRRMQRWRKQHPEASRQLPAHDADRPRASREQILPPALPVVAPEDLATLRDRVQRQADILTGLVWQTVGAHADQVAPFLARCGEQGRMLRATALG